MEKAELAAIFIQKAIRGRAIQNMMYEGKEKRLELVNEVRTTHALQKAEQQLKKAERQNVVTLQRQRRLYQQKVRRLLLQNIIKFRKRATMVCKIFAKLCLTHVVRSAFF